VISEESAPFNNNMVAPETLLLSSEICPVTLYCPKETIDNRSQKAVKIDFISSVFD
jgi:hypothetical protein